MALVINANPAATAAFNVLKSSNTSFQKSLARISNGFKIQTPSDDAGGLAVSMKMQAAIRRTDSLIGNLANAISFLQTQDGAMALSSNILTRLSELYVLSQDSTKSSNDVNNYNTEFLTLQNQLHTLLAESFNGVALFVVGGGSQTIVYSEDGTQNLTISLVDLESTLSSILLATDLSSTNTSMYTTALQTIATNRANNGSQVNRLEFASQILVTNRSNLEAANSRIMDTDIALESTRFARYDILVKSGTVMLAQANLASKNIIRLLN